MTLPLDMPFDPGEAERALKPGNFVAIRQTIGTQEEVAGELRISRKSIGRYEGGERRIPYSLAIAIVVLAVAAARRRETTVAALAELPA
jgi:DNA-binding XRE family transcriptional regulator